MAILTFQKGDFHTYSAEGQDVNNNINLNRLSDVTVLNVQNNQVLKYNSSTSQWENVDAGSITLLDLGDLVDVTITTPADGDLIQYNSTSGDWENTNVIDGGTF